MTLNKIPESMIESVFVKKVNDATVALVETATKAELANVLDGSPKGVYATLANLQTAYPAGTTGVYLVTFDGHIYSWSGSAWADRGLYQAVGIANGSVTGEKLGTGTLRLTTGKNLFNKATVTPNKYVDSTDGVLKTPSPDPAVYVASDWISVTASTPYYSSNPHHIAFYTSNKTYISGLIMQTTFTTPVNCVYVRMGVSTGFVNIAQLELGSVKTTYEAYHYKLNPMDGAIPIKIVPSEYSVGSGELVNESVTSDKVAYAAITGEKLGAGTLKLKVGKNLFNKSTVTMSKYVNSTWGYLSDANPNPAVYNASDFIAVKPSTAYIRSHVHQMAFYNASKVFISGLDTGNVFTTPSNCSFIRVTIPASSMGTYQLELGSVTTVYEDYSYTIDTMDGGIPIKIVPSLNSIGSKELVNASVTTDKVANAAITPNKTNFIVRGKNIFDKSAVTIGHYVADLHGGLIPNASYNTSAFIPIEPQTAYFTTYNRFLAFYKEDGNYISGIEGNGLGTGGQAYSFSFVTPPNAYLMRISVLATAAGMDQLQVEKGTEYTGYEAHGLYLESKYIQAADVSTDDVILFLPSEICIAVGRTIELYNKQVLWAGNQADYHFKWNCPVGKSMERKWSCLGVTEKIGNHALTCTVYDNNMNFVASATTTIKIVSGTLAATKKLLTIGDSLTNTKPWLAELEILSASKIVQVGTRGTGTLMQEGRSGFTAGGYLAATDYAYQAEGVHPFWNPNTSSFDYAYYKTQTGVNPDAIQLFLGTNGIALDPTVNATNIKTIVDKIREVDSVIPICVVFTLFRGDQNGMGKQLSSDGYSAGSGVWKLEEDRKVHNLMVKLNSLLKLYSNLHFVPIALAHDSEYNFGSTTTPVNPRATQTEPQAIEATHPQVQGYMQMADIMFSVMAKLWAS